MIPVLFFIIASLITVFAAMKLADYADAIAETTGLGHSLVGLILLSAATSLPELFSSSSASIIGNVDLSFGNIFGSNMTNIFVIVIMDFFVKNKPVLLSVSQRNVMTGGIVVVVTCVALLIIYIAQIERLKGIDFWYLSIVLFAFYIGAIFVIYKFEKANVVEDNPNDKNENSIAKRKAIVGFVIASVVVFSAAILLSWSANEISKFSIGGKTLGGTFVGTLFMAFTTSLPEIVVSIAALRLGSMDMALGNLFGSNLFNLAILSFSDGFYRLGSFYPKLFPDNKAGDDAFTVISPDHNISALIGLVFIGIVLSSLILRKQKKKGVLGFDTLIIGVLYISVLFLLFVLRPA